MTSENVETLLLIEISDILRVTQEGQPSDIPTFIPSLSHTSGDVDMREIYRGRSRYFGKSYKQCGTCDYVRILYVSSYGFGISKIFMVEEAFDYSTIGK